MENKVDICIFGLLRRNKRGLKLNYDWGIEISQSFTNGLQQSIYSVYFSYSYNASVA